jgi:ABC-2 type transport system permease protein
MAWVFVKLKLRLLRNGLRLGGWQQIAGLVFAGLLALALIPGGFALLAILPRHDPDAGATAAITVFVAVFLGWLLLPLFSGTLDTSLDPAKLALLPLRPRQLAVGLFAAACVGLGPLGTLLALLGALVGFTPIGPGALEVVAAVLLEFALCVVTARAVTTVLSRWLRSRRARDLVILIVSLSALLLNLTLQIVVRAIEPGRLSGGARTAGRIFGWSPPGLAAQALVAGSQGRLGVAALELLAVAAVVALLGWWWYASLQRLLVTVEPATAPRPQQRELKRQLRVEGEGGPGAWPALFPRPLATLLPANRLGAVAAKELRYYARHPRLRVQWLTAGLFAIALPVFFTLSSRAGPPSPGSPGPGSGLGGGQHPHLVFTALIGIYVAINQTVLNQFGADGMAYWTNVVASGDPRDDLAGKSLALALPTYSLVTVVALVIAAITGGFAWVPLTLCLAVGLLGAGLAVGMFTSVHSPFPLPGGTTNLWGGRGSGQGCAVGMTQLLAMLTAGVLCAPLGVLVGIGLTWWHPALVIAAPVAVVYGLLLWRFGLFLAADWLRGHQPELLATLSPRRVA